ncbi:TPA: hypothetical protein RXK52_001132 [Campylobacter coli]|nr:hypothetical protein [Campylobacter coli]HEH5459626.1 hypothetical protein [Campylobacter coli]
MLTGTYAICYAIARGYKEIYLAGMDLFENKEQDAYFYGKGYGIIESIHNKIKIWRLLNFCKICRRKNKISIWKNKTSIKVEILFFYKP